MSRKGFMVLLLGFWSLSFFLHLAWENWQVVFYEGIASAPHAEAVWICTKASFGDANIALSAYLLAAFQARSRQWILAPTHSGLAVYMLTGLVATVVMEYLATQVWDRWSYSARMLVVPVFNTGLLPLVQWLVLPPVYLVAARWLYLGFNSDSAVSRKLQKRIANETDAG